MLAGHCIDVVESSSLLSLLLSTQFLRQEILSLQLPKIFAASKLEMAMEKIREQCIARGARGIIGLSRTFRFLDENIDRKLSKEELKIGLDEYGVSLEDDEIDEAFQIFDRDGNGTIIFDEFLRGIRPPMSDTRLELIDAAFAKMDQTGEGVVTVEDLRGVYSAAEHPKFLSGQMSEDEIFEKFLKNFDCPNDPDGKVTKEDFTNYYAGVSSSIDEEEYFETMMKKAWQL